MAQPSVVVAFSSRCGTTETLAHAATVGVVNARALPRLRRLVDRWTRPGECADTLRRMQKEYVPPTEADIAGAPALVIVPGAGMTPASDAWQPLIAILDPLASSGRLAGKLGAVIDAGEGETLASFSPALTARGLMLITAAGGDARAHGRTVGAALRVSAQG
jgi:hypothetical protein